MKTKLGIIGLCLLLLLNLWCVPVSAENTAEIIIDSVEVNKMGEGTIIGHISTGEVGIQITCIVGTPDLFKADGYLDESKFDMNHVMHIDQVGTGNNGTFLIEFGVDKKWSNHDAKIIFGCTYGVNAWYDFTVPELPPGIEVISNNSVLYGREIFYVNSFGYIPENIATALSRGGNNIYFFFGDSWYNLMSEAAVDNSFLVKDNASPTSEIEKLRPSYYWGVSEKMELKWAEEVVQFMDADVKVSINAYTPTITGTVSCIEGKTITLDMRNKTDNTIIASEKITSANGVFNLNYKLPSLLKAREYEIVLSCVEGDTVLADASVIIDSSILALDLTGKVSTAKNVDIKGSLKSVNTGLIDQDVNFTGTKEVSATVPNILSSASFQLKAKGYETVTVSV